MTQKKKKVKGRKESSSQATTAKQGSGEKGGQKVSKEQRVQLPSPPSPVPAVPYPSFISLTQVDGFGHRIHQYQEACPEDYALEYFSSSALQQLAPHLFELVFALTKHNMLPFHPPSGQDMAWDDQSKWRDLTSLKNAHYFLLISRSVCVESVAGLLYIQQTTEIDDDDGESSSNGQNNNEEDGEEDEENDPVLYCYDLQIDPAHQSRGLGKFLMWIYLDLAAYLSVRPMLTVFKSNVRAIELYHNFGFELDRNDPSLYLHPRRAEKVPYLILSRPLESLFQVTSVLI